MRSTSPRHPRHAHHAQPDQAAGSAGPEPGPAAPPRRSRARFLAIALPLTGLLTVAALVGMDHMAGHSAHIAADDTVHHQAGKAAVKALAASPTCCISSAISSASPGLSSPGHAAKVKKKAVSKATAASTNSPADSGAAVPGAVPGWRLVYSTDFSGSSLPAGWDAYRGEPGGDPYGWWDPANVSVGGGALHLRTTSNNDPNQGGVASTGGVAFYGSPQTYGMYLVRMKGDYEPGLAINNLAILWPADSNVWPPEVDFFQDLGGSRQTFSASLHAGPDGNGSCCVISSPTQDNNGTQWHTYGVEWTPTSIVYTIDGRQWGSTISRNQLGSPAQWPTIPMNLTLQSQNQGSAQPANGTETMTVDWVAEYTANG
jgi:beta-glucanase (GH16 family)